MGQKTLRRRPAPPISDELLEYLSSQFSDRIPESDKDVTEKSIARLMGQRDVLRHLRVEAAAQRSAERNP